MIWILLLCLLSGFQTVFAAGTCGTNVKYTVSGNTITFARSNPDRTAVWKENCGEVFKEEENITVVKIMDKIKVKDAFGMFYLFEYVEKMDLRNLDLSGVTDISSMFNGCYNLKTLNVSGWDTSKVTDMTKVFASCFELESLDLNSWNTSKVEKMSGMFEHCTSLKKLNISGWKTSNVVNMRNMFRDCSSLTELDLSSWKTSNVYKMDGMFRDCSSLTGLDLSSWKTSDVYEMEYMFMNCSSLTELDLSGWDTSAVKNMSYMFKGCSSLTGLNLSGWNTAGLQHITHITDVFKGCTSLKVLVLGRNTLKKNIFKSLPKYKNTWYYAVQGAAAGDPLPLKTAKTNGTLFTKYRYNTMAGAWSTRKNPGLASSITIRNSKGKDITGKTVTSRTLRYQLRASAKPESAAQTVTWKSSNTKIATVTKAGKVIFRKAGTVKITAESTDIAKKTASVKLKLLPKATSIIIRDPNGKAVTGTAVTSKTLTYQLSASALPAKAEQTVTWKSSNTKIAAVSKKGLVTFNVPGTVTITATSTDRGKKNADVKITFRP